MNVVMESYLDKQTPKLCLDFQTLITVWRTVSVQRWHECQSKFDWFSMTTDKSLSCSHWVIYRQELCVFVFCLIVCVWFFWMCIYYILFDSTPWLRDESAGYLGWCLLEESVQVINKAKSLPISDKWLIVLQESWEPCHSKYWYTSFR